MKTVTESCVVGCTPETFWSVFLDEAYLRGLYLEGFGYRSYQVLELTASGRKVKVVPKLKLPGVVEKLIGDSFAYEEHGTLDRPRGLWTWRMKPSKEFVATSGTIRIEATGDGQSRRTDEVKVEGKVFGLGGVLEGVVEKELHATWAKERAFFASWLAKRASAPAATT